MFAKVTTGLALAACVGLAQMSAASAAETKPLKVKVGSVKSGGMVPTQYSFCQAAAQGHAGPGKDLSPPISWSKGPKGTKSYAIILNDTDSPKTERDKMNKEGMTVPSTAERQTFYHWVLVDIPANVRSLKMGADSKERMVHGKTAPATVGKHGLNMFTMAFASNEAMKGNYYGYDGPCPPWNDDNLHHYHFMVYALSVDSLGLPADFDGPAAMEAMKGKVLAEGKLDTMYTTNPAKGAKVPKK
ncbi:MAG: YbhB/YbcL family Raf kinase inhibitor-like protein [Pseudolabrys sp.]